MASNNVQTSRSVSPTEVTFLMDLDIARRDYTIKVRIIRLWKRPKYNNPSDWYSIEFIIDDEQGTTMQGNVLKKWFPKFEKLLVESGCYLIRKPGITLNETKYRYVENRNKIGIQPDTEVKICNDFSSLEYGFSFTSFEHIVEKTLPDEQPLAQYMASSSTSFSASLSWNHDVFLSFRGEDTRKTIVDHLYKSLEDHGIHTYKDDITLRRGASVGPALLKAIQESRIAVIVFSENYADSSWCLDELAHIMKCMDIERGQIVIPIFYHVDPSDIRKQKGKYKEAFDKHELENKTKVESWRKALFDAANLSGWVPKDTANGHESKFIEQIVKDISHRLYSLLPSTNEHLIGIVSRVHNLKMKVELGSGGVLMIGIWGVGGSGKTTLASSLYDDISGTFDGCCFLENIREKARKDGLKELQEKILCIVSRQRKVVIERVEDGKRMIKSKLYHRKVLIVLDDVSEQKQLEALVGSHDWFGEGSRIIITTRDENLLNSHKVNMIHHTSLLDDKEAIELFCKRAPRDYRNIEDYEMLSKGVVSYAGGLPLALIVLGSFLSDKDINEWRSTLARLKEIPNADIMETLKISYDGLNEVEKTLFLDIACFFRGKYKNNAMEIFDACGLHPVIGIKVLIQKALITISNGFFEMHDLIQEMGHYIVKGDHRNNPEKHSRIWEKKDVQSIWAMDATKELDRIEAISVDSYMYDSLPSQNNQVVANMKNLRWIEWNVGRESSLPKNFPPAELRCLILMGRLRRQLWKGYKFLPNLRMIKLQATDYLITTPEFSGLPNLEILMLHTSWSIKEIHPSIGRLERLVYLSVEYCTSFEKFPPVSVIKKLETLVISNCHKLSNRRKKASSFKQHCTNFFVTCWACCCGNAHEGELSDDVQAPFLAHKGMNHVGLQFVSRCLTKLILRRCDFQDEDIDSDVWDLPNLQELDLSLNLFSRLKFSILKLPRLKWLDVSGCESLVELSGFPSSISSLRADGCGLLKTVGDTSNCKWLWNVSFSGRNNGVSALGGDLVLHSLLEGNAIEDHYISFTHSAGHHIPKRFVDRLVRGKSFTLQLPPNWYNEYSGFLICNANNYYAMSFTISMKQDLDNDSRSEVWEEFDEVPESHFNSTYVGYVSFNSLMRHGARLNPAYNKISIAIVPEYAAYYEGESRFLAELVPRRRKDDHTVETRKTTTDCSQFYDEEREYGKAFTIQRHSESSVKILWRPCYWY